MATPTQRDPRIDAYIDSAAEFARPILRHLRELVHEACPEATETLKWGMPSFEYQGLLCGLAAFKSHCVFGFWKHELLFGDAATATRAGKRAAATRSSAKAKTSGGRPTPGTTKATREAKPAARDEAMGQFGRLTSLAQLPPRRTMLSYIRQAAELNERGVKVPRKVKPRQKLVVPDDLAAGLRRNKAAAAVFSKFSYSKQKDYIEWLTEAKRPETRARRLATALAWIAAGKSRNWKYEKC